jgi:NADH-quinone oxidoreductase subunit N
MAATVKAAAFAAFIRVWLEAFPATLPGGGGQAAWHPALNGLAIATMIFGNAIGLAQKNLKRMLAYSSIGHAGYLLVAIAAGTIQGSAALLFYIFIYTLATFGAFAVVVTLTREGENSVMLDDLAGLWSVRPWLAFSMAVMMLALLGFPIFGGAGFFAKWYVLQAALQAPVKQTMLAVVLVVTTVVSAGYYLHVVMLMFMRARSADTPVPERSGGLTRVVLAVSVGFILLIGLIPEQVIEAARNGRPRMDIEPSPVALTPPAPLTPSDSVRQIAEAVRAAKRSR